MTTTMKQAVTLPGVEQLRDALLRLEYIWDLVPRSARPNPQNKAVKEDLQRTIEQCIRFAEARKAELARRPTVAAPPNDVGVDGEGESEGELDEPPLAIVMRLMRTLEPEQLLQVKILLLMRDLSNEGRLELFDEIQESHHVDCGSELYEDETHECPVDSGDDEGSDGEDVEGAAPRRIAAEPSKPLQFLPAPEPPADGSNAVDPNGRPSGV